MMPEPSGASPNHKTECGTNGSFKHHQTHTFPKECDHHQRFYSGIPTFVLFVLFELRIVHCNRNVLKDSMVSSASFEECSIKTYAMRPALEWALINLHGDSSLESCAGKWCF
jgi:hypothetical protein